MSLSDPCGLNPEPSYSRSRRDGMINGSTPHGWSTPSHGAVPLDVSYKPRAGLVAGGYLLRKHWDDINKEFEEFEKVCVSDACTPCP